MSVCPTVSGLRFYGCCHPCFRTVCFDLRVRDTTMEDKLMYIPMRIDLINRPIELHLHEIFLLKVKQTK